MNIEFFYHLSILSIIFFIICSGFKFFLKIRSTLDLSYLGIIIFSTYLGFILNNHFGTSLLVSTLLSFLFSIPITFLLLLLSSKLDGVYFVIGTLSIYMIFLQIVKNTEELTGGIFGLSLNKQNIIGNNIIGGIQELFWIYLIITVVILLLLFYIKKSFFFKILKGWGENELSLKTLGVNSTLYKFGMILLTTFLAALGGNLYGFYHMYIEPNSFWFIMLDIVLIISLISYKLSNIGTLIVSFLIIGLYEYIRFFKIVEISQIGYFREIIFGLIIMITSFVVFKFTKFGREI